MNPNDIWWIKNALALAILKRLLEQANEEQRHGTNSIVDVYEDDDKIALTALMTKVRSKKDIDINVTKTQVTIEFQGKEYPFTIRDNIKIDPATTKATFKPETGVLDISIRKVNA